MHTYTQLPHTISRTHENRIKIKFQRLNTSGDCKYRKENIQIDKRFVVDLNMLAWAWYVIIEKFELYTNYDVYLYKRFATEELEIDFSHRVEQQRWCSLIRSARTNEKQHNSLRAHEVRLPGL